MIRDERDRLMIQSCQTFWNSIRDLPAEDAQFATLLHLWSHARRLIPVEEFQMMLIRPLAFVDLMREGCPPEEILGRLVGRMEELYRVLRAQERERKLAAQGNDSENIVPFVKPPTK